MAFSSPFILKCFCGHHYTNPIDLEEHRRARGHFASHVCGRYCKHPIPSEEIVRSRECGCCGKVCERPDILDDHRVATGHCFCSDCSLPFESQSALNDHRQTEMHASEFRCCDCDILFQDIHALNAHMASRAHRKPLTQKSSRTTSKKLKKSVAKTPKNTECNECQRTFRSLQSLEQHRKSTKHKPLSDLACPMREGCRGRFSSPSALLQHLESGNCRSGMNRDRIYRIVQSCDQDRVIHKALGLTPSSSPSLSTCESSLGSSIQIIPSDTESEWSLVATPMSESIAEESLMQWSLLEGSQISIEELSFSTTIALNLRCSLCPNGRKMFATAQALQQHMDSPVHYAKIYHCPNNISTTISGKAGKQRREEKQFSTLGGLTQHLESGACHGGKRTFFRSMEFIQRRLEQLGFVGIPLLLPGCRK